LAETYRKVDNWEENLYDEIDNEAWDFGANILVGDGDDLFNQNNDC